jgi:protein-tyrosine phosphatase
VSLWFRSYGFADVHPDLLIGAYPLDDEDVGMLTHLGVDRILNLVQDTEYREGDRAVVEAALEQAGIEEQRLDLTDYGGLPSTEIEEAVTRVLEWLQAGHRVYLHCRAGWQRSAAIAAGVVAIREGLAIEDALAVVQARKPSADPLAHQREDLLWWWRERNEAAPHPGASREQRD